MRFLRDKTIIPLASFLGSTKNFLLDIVKIFLLTIKNFKGNQIILRASALTFFSLMSVVPVVALSFAVARGFGMERMLRKEIINKLSGQQEVINWIIHFANTLLDKTKNNVVAGIGIVVLLWAVMQVLSNIESSFNDIWKIKKSRSFSRKVSDYFSIMFIAPVFVILSSSATVFVSTQVSTIVESTKYLGLFSPIIRLLIGIIPFALVWFLFTFIYKVMPNTKVKYKPAITAGIIAGTLFQLSQWAYLKFQITVSGYNAIYGSFAALPLFMIWLQIGWFIVLFGAEFSFAVQNYEKYEFQKESSQISHEYRKALSLLIITYIVKKFARSEPAPDVEELSVNLQMPAMITRDIVNRLHDAGLISKVIGDDINDINYQPASDISYLTVNDVFIQLDLTGINNLDIANVDEMKNIRNIIEKFTMSKAGSEANVLIKDI